MEQSQSSPSFLKRVLAVVVLVIAAWIILKVVISAAVAIAWIAAVILAVVGVVWAIRTI
jgi:hypothetical protein